MKHFTKEHKLYILLAGFFVTNAILAEMIGVKIFSLEKLLGFEPINLSILGYDGLSFNLTAGVLLWPVVFVMTDLINEYYGMKGVKRLSWLAVGLIVYAFIMISATISMPPADFWIKSHLPEGVPIEDYKQDVSNYNSAFRLVFGQGLFIIIGSMVAFMVGQLLDVLIFHKIKSMTGEKSIWLRATGSTIISQLIDSFIVLFIAFYIGADWSLKLVIAICIVNYIYKFSIALIVTPILYLVHGIIEKYLGHDLATRLKQEAMASD